MRFRIDDLRFMIGDSEAALLIEFKTLHWRVR